MNGYIYFLIEKILDIITGELCKYGFQYVKQALRSRNSKPLKSCFYIELGSIPLSEEQIEQLKTYLPNFLKTGLKPLYSERTNQLLMWEPELDDTQKLLAKLKLIFGCFLSLKRVTPKHTYLWTIYHEGWKELY